MDQSIYVFMVVGGIFFIFIQTFKETSVSRQWRPDQKPHFAASELGPLCFPMSHKKDARLIWVKKVESEKDLGVIFGSKINFIGGGGL